MKTKRIATVCFILMFTQIFLFCCVQGECAEKSDPLPAKTYSWKMVLAKPTGAVANTPFIEFAKEVEKRSNGRINITVYEATLGIPSDFWDMSKKNVVQFAVNGEGYSPGRLPLTSIVGLPFEIGGPEACGSVLNKLYTAGKLPELSDNFKVLFFTPTNSHMLFLAKKKVTKMEDFVGLKLGPVPGLGSNLVKALGGTPVIVPGAERYLTLQTGVLDGILTPVDDVVDRKFYEVIKYAVNVPLYDGFFLLQMNLETYNALPNDLKLVIDRAAQNARDKEVKRNVQYADECWRTLAQKGIEVYTISPEELVRWRKAASDIPEKWVANNTKLPARETLQFVRETVKNFYKK